MQEPLSLVSSLFWVPLRSVQRMVRWNAFPVVCLLRLGCKKVGHSLSRNSARSGTFLQIVALCLCRLGNAWENYPSICVGKFNRCSRISSFTMSLSVFNGGNMWSAVGRGIFRQSLVCDSPSPASTYISSDGFFGKTGGGGRRDSFFLAGNN